MLCGTRSPVPQNSICIGAGWSHLACIPPMNCFTLADSRSLSIQAPGVHLWLQSPLIVTAAAFTGMLAVSVRAMTFAGAWLPASRLRVLNTQLRPSGVMVTTP